MNYRAENVSTYKILSIIVQDAYVILQSYVGGIMIFLSILFFFYFFIFICFSNKLFIPEK